MNTRIPVTTEQDGDCLLVTSHRPNKQGYIVAWQNGRPVYLHRLVADAGPDDTVDHTCHNADLTCKGGPTCKHRRCINPEHLDLTTRGDNVQRAAGRVTHCPQGHALTPDNVYRRTNRPGVECRTCVRKRAHESYHSRHFS